MYKKISLPSNVAYSDRSKLSDFDTLPILCGDSMEVLGVASAPKISGKYLQVDVKLDKLIQYEHTFNLSYTRYRVKNILGVMEWKIKLSHIELVYV